MYKFILIGAGIGCGLAVVLKPVDSDILVPLECKYKKEKEPQFLAVQSFKLETQWLCIVSEESKGNVRDIIATYFMYGELTASQMLLRDVEEWHKIRSSIHPP